MVSRSHIISPRHELLDLTKPQLDEAKKDYREAKEKEQQKARDKAQLAGQPEPVFADIDDTIPAGTFIRGARPSRQGLLLLYPLDPTAVGPSLNPDTPIMGYALSIPHIEGDERVQYAVDQAYQAELDSEEEEYDEDEAAAVL